VHPHRLRLTLRTVLPDGVLEVADQLLLLGVDRDRRLARCQRRRHLLIDVAELRIVIGVVATLAGLAVGLQAVAKPAQQIAHRVVSDPVPQRLQSRRQIAQALGRPQQWRLAAGVSRIFQKRVCWQPGNTFKLVRMEFSARTASW